MSARLRQFVCGFTSLVDNHGGHEAAMLAEGSKLLRELVAQDDWLPEASAAADPARYQQHLLWCDRISGSPLSASSEGRANPRRCMTIPSGA